MARYNTVLFSFQTVSNLIFCPIWLIFLAKLPILWLSLAIYLRCQTFAGDKSQGNTYDSSLVLLNLFLWPLKTHPLSSRAKKETEVEKKKGERKNRLRGFNICMKEHCHWQAVVIQHDKLERECHYRVSQQKKQRCHIQNRTQESWCDLARVFSPFLSKPDTNTETMKRCWLVLYVSPWEPEERKNYKNIFFKMKLPNHFHF